MNIQKEYTERELIEKDLKLMVYYVNEGLIGNRMLWMYPSMILKGNMYVCMYVQCPWSVPMECVGSSGTGVTGYDPPDMDARNQTQFLWKRRNHS